MGSKIYQLFWVAVAVAAIYLLIRYMTLTDENSKLRSELFRKQRTLDAADAKINDLQGIVQRSFNINGQTLSGPFFSDLFAQNKEPKLVFRFVPQNCNPCIDQQLKSLKDISAKVGTHQIVILANFNTERNLTTFTKVNNVDFPAYNLHSVAPSLDVMTMPYYFVVSKDLKIQHFFVPLIDSPQLTDEYLASVVTHLN